MPTAFLRSPADSLTNAHAANKAKRSKRRGLLLQEDKDQDGLLRSRDLDRDVGPQGTGPNMSQNRDITAGSSDDHTNSTGGKVVRPQDTQTGVVGQEPNDREDAADSVAPIGHGELMPMSEGEVQSALHKMCWDSIEYVDQELSPARALMDQYYQGEPYGDEEEGRSQIITTEVRDTILMIMPSLMRIFFGAERAVEFAPGRADQIEMAEQATEFTWDVTVLEDNHGFRVFYEWFKDALLKKLGIVKWWTDAATETRTFEASMLSMEQVVLLQQDHTITIDEIRPSQGADPDKPSYDVDYSQTKTEHKQRFVCLPPEEYLFTRGARTTDSDRMHPGVALFVGHRTELTRSQLLEMGVSEEDIEEWAFKDVSLDHNVEEIRRQHIVKPDTSAIGPIATQKALWIEGYPYLDVDGDGVAELRKVTMLGPSYHVIENVRCNERPFAVICPDPEPHTIVGQCPADYVADLQKLTSKLWRAMGDSLAYSINPRLGYIDGDVNLEDILAVEVGAPIRMRSQGSLFPIEHNFVGREALAVIDKVAEIKENRTGITKASAGLDADALQSSSKAAVSATVTSAQAHIELIARMFAETGVKQLMVGLLRQLVAHANQSRIVKVRGTYVEMDPRAWDAALPVKVKVAIGAGLDDDKYQVLADFAVKCEQIFGTMGLANPIVTPRQYRDTLVKMLKLRGRMDADTMLLETDPQWQPPPPPEQDPNMVIAKAEEAKAQAHIQKQAADQQLDQKKHELTMATKAADVQLDIQRQQVETARHAEELALRRQEMQMVDERERTRIAMEIALGEKRLQMEHDRKVHEINLAAETERAKIALAHKAAMSNPKGE